MINRLMLGNGTSKKKDFIWNMLGSGIYAVSAVLLSFLTIRIVGEELGGIFAIAITLSQLVMYIAYFELRNYQITDSKNEFSFNEYHSAKLVLCLLMMVVSFIYVATRNYSNFKSFVVLLMCFYRMTDGYADVYESQFQKDGRLDVAGKSLAIRTTLTTIVYFVALFITGDILVSLICTCISAVIFVIVFLIIPFSGLYNIGISKNVRTIIDIIKKSFPLFFAMFVWSYLLSASRMAIDSNMTDKYQAYYQIIFLPVSVINLVAGFIFRPILVDLTEMYKDKKVKEFYILIAKNIMLISAFTLICMLGAYLMGIPVLSILSGCELQEYRLLLVFLIMAGGINAYSVIFYYILTIYRDRRTIIFGYAISAVFAFISSDYFVKHNGLWGGAISFCLTAALLVMIFMVAVFIGFRKKKL